MKIATSVKVHLNHNVDNVDNEALKKKIFVHKYINWRESQCDRKKKVIKTVFKTG